MIPFLNGLLNEIYSMVNLVCNKFPHTTFHLDKPQTDRQKLVYQWHLIHTLYTSMQCMPYHNHLIQVSRKRQCNSYWPNNILHTPPQYCNRINMIISNIFFTVNHQNKIMICHFDSDFFLYLGLNVHWQSGTQRLESI